MVSFIEQAVCNVNRELNPLPKFPGKVIGFTQNRWALVRGYKQKPAPFKSAEDRAYGYGYTSSGGYRVKHNGKWYAVPRTWTPAQIDTYLCNLDLNEMRGERQTTTKTAKKAPKVRKRPERVVSYGSGNKSVRIKFKG